MPQGFASMSIEKRKQISSLGGKAAQANGTARRWTKEEAREAGKKGGSSHSVEHMRELGRKGGKASQLKRKQLDALK